MALPNIRIALAALHPGEAGLKLYVTPEVGRELSQDLERAGFKPREIMEFSLPADPMMIFAVAGAFATIGGLRGLAAVLVAFFERHKSVSIEMRVGESEISLTGMSADEMSPHIDEFLTMAKERQAQLDDQWERVRRERRALEAGEEPTDPPHQR